MAGNPTSAALAYMETLYLDVCDESSNAVTNRVKAVIYPALIENVDGFILREELSASTASVMSHVDSIV